MLRRINISFKHVLNLFQNITGSTVRASEKTWKEWLQTQNSAESRISSTEFK